jgi:protocatechuate 3,4-dioxygenase beta subunit
MPYQIDEDDTPVGRVLTRREALTVIGGAMGVVVLAACGPGAVASVLPGATATQTPGGTVGPTGTSGATTGAVPSCIVRPELTEGPYFVDGQLERSDIRSDPDSGEVREGLPHALAFAVSRVDAGACTALEGALVDVWHCDALGVYSGVSDPGFDTSGERWLRGYQVTDANGRASFTTIYPGWYQGRAVHIHFKIRTDPQADAGTEFTSQLFFDDAVSDTVYEQAPYNEKGERDVRNDDDGIYRQSEGQLLLALTGDAQSGFQALFEVGIEAA